MQAHIVFVDMQYNPIGFSPPITGTPYWTRWGFEAGGSTNFDAQSKTVVMMDTTKDRGIEG